MAGGDFSSKVDSEDAGTFGGEDLASMDPADPWTAVAKMFKFIFKRFDADNARFAALEERRAAANGRDGVGITDARIDGAGHLVIEFSDGIVRDLGRVVGRDAPPAPAPQSLEFVRDSDGRIVKSVLR
jgi:hypothetical protein